MFKRSYVGLYSEELMEVIEKYVKDAEK